MTTPDLLTALAPVVAQLERMRVRYFVSGSVASSVYGVARTTLDIDLVADLRRQHVEPFVASLQAEYYVSDSMIREAIANRSCFNVIHLATMFKVDVFVLKEREFDQLSLQRIRRDTIGDETAQLEVTVASPEDVILNKLEWYKKGDEVSQRQWQDAIGVLKVQREQLDFDYLRKWSVELALTELLERALRASQ